MLVDRDHRAWLVEWGTGKASTDPAHRAADVAELAVSLSLASPPELVVQAAARALPSDALADAVQHLQPLALAPFVGRQLADRPGLLDELRELLAATAGVPAPVTLSPARAVGRNLLPLVAVGVAVSVLLPRLSKATVTLATFRSASWPWVAAMAAAALATYVMASIALISAACVPLAAGRTFVVQLAATFTNRVLPAGIGAAATNIRYLELAGMEPSSATSTVVLTSASGLAVHTVGVAAAALLVGSRFDVPRLPDFEASWPALVALGAGSTAAGWAIWRRRMHRPAARRPRPAGWGPSRRPWSPPWAPCACPPPRRWRPPWPSAW